MTNHHSLKYFRFRLQLENGERVGSLVTTRRAAHVGDELEKDGALYRVAGVASEPPEDAAFDGTWTVTLLKPAEPKPDDSQASPPRPEPPRPQPVDIAKEVFADQRLRERYEGLLKHGACGESLLGYWPDDPLVKRWWAVMTRMAEEDGLLVQTGMAESFSFDHGSSYVAYVQLTQRNGEPYDESTVAGERADARHERLRRQREHDWAPELAAARRRLHGDTPSG